MSDTDPLDDHAAKIRGLLGVTNDERDRQRHHGICDAIRDASICANCRKPIAATEPVWRTQIYIGPGFFGGGSRYWVAPHCADCVSDLRDLRKAAPCKGCGRDVHNEYNFRGHSRTFCCAQCERRARAAEARRQRAEVRGSARGCAECGEMFQPTRSDSKFCRAACRQKAYRHRVTANESAHGFAHGSRNARRYRKRVADNKSVAEAPTESRNADDLSIPSFLRRSAS